MSKCLKLRALTLNPPSPHLKHEHCNWDPQESLWIGAASSEVLVGQGNPPIKRNSSTLVDLGEEMEAFCSWFAAGSTKVLPYAKICWINSPSPHPALTLLSASCRFANLLARTLLSATVRFANLLDHTFGHSSWPVLCGLGENLAFDTG